MSKMEDFQREWNSNHDFYSDSQCQSICLSFKITSQENFRFPNRELHNQSPYIHAHGLDMVDTPRVEQNYLQSPIDSPNQNTRKKLGKWKANYEIQTLGEAMNDSCYDKMEEMLDSKDKTESKSQLGDLISENSLLLEQSASILNSSMKMSNKNDSRAFGQNSTLTGQSLNSYESVYHMAEYQNRLNPISASK